ncbi:MAG: two-component sensor histidine kinase [Ardenticatenia bacterium]|nr:MAG: two-component sensor histidine kinase [Ardenticatenia bacterium]
MRAVHYVRRHLVWKLLVSYLIVILVGIIVLISAVEYFMPSAFERHLAAMATAMQTVSPALAEDLFTNFRRAMNESLIFSLVAAFLVAVIASTVISRRIVMPVRRMMMASQRIAEGHYHERVELPGTHDPDNLDELGCLAISFNQMATQLERIETTRRELIGDVAHELRTPLTTIKGYLEGLMDGVIPADISTFQRIYHETERLQRLIQDLQDLSRVESGAIEMHPQPISVTQLINTAVARLSHQFEEKGVQLATSLPEHLPAVWADEARIGQVLLNLLGNALQYTPPGGHVLVSAQQRGAEVHITVTDTGIGISAEHLPLIFTRFYRVDRSRSRASGGSGIGLTIARHLVEAHGGRIWAESAGPGKGSTFTFTLPVAS